MNKIEEFISSLSRTPKKRIIDHSVSFLMREADLRKEIAEYLKMIGTKDFYNLSRNRNLSLLVPKNIILYSSPRERYSIILNYFDINKYRETKKLGLQKPHGHRFSFTSIILNGGFTQCFYEKDSKSSRYHLKKKLYFKSGNIYRLSRYDIHEVIKPRQDTLTLMICNHTSIKNNYIVDEAYTKNLSDHLFKKILNILLKNDGYKIRFINFNNSQY